MRGGRALIVAAIALAASGCAMSLNVHEKTPATAPAAASRPAGAPDADLPQEVIDAHIHASFSGRVDPDSLVDESREGLAEELRRNHVVGAVAMDHDGKPYEDLSELHVVHCAGLDGPLDMEPVEKGLASGRYRCIKIYLGYVHRYASDPAYEPAYRLAAKYRVPVVFHTGDTDSPRAKLKYADPLTVDEVAVEHPDVTFVLAHAGNPWIESAAEVAYKNRNVVIDGSAFLIGDLDRFPPETVEEYVVKPVRWIFGYVADPKKLMFGTDWPLTRIGPYLEAFKRAIPKEHWRAVFHDNAARVYGLDASRDAASEGH